MKRSPIVAVGTVVGLASVLSFHTSPVKITLNPSPGTTSVPPSTTTTRPSKKPTTTTTTKPPATTTTVGHHSTTTTTVASHPHSTTTTVAPTTTTVAPTTTTTVPATGVRTVTGPLVNYYYGELSVKVTADGSKITSVTIGTLSDGGNPRSQQIDQYAIPLLEPEAVAAQSYKIQSVSGASYTSAGFEMSMQYALKKLGL